MVRQDQSPTDFADRGLPRPPRSARIRVLVLIWVVCWCVSVLSFHIQKGFLPHGVGELLVAPLLLCVVTLPLSFGGVILHVFRWLPASYEGTVMVLGAIAFWPCYVTFLILALRTGKWRYFVASAVVCCARRKRGPLSRREGARSAVARWGAGCDGSRSARGRYEPRGREPGWIEVQEAA